jgi:hypothetical protein
LGKEYRSRSSSLWSFLHRPVTSFLLGPNIPPNTLFSNTLSLRSSLSVSDQVSHPYKTTGTNNNNNNNNNNNLTASGLSPGGSGYYTYI